jgi:hypothetical protein
MRRTTVAAAALAIVLPALCPQMTRAEERKIPVQEASTLTDALSPFVGQNVSLLLSSGREVQGKLEKIGVKVVHLSKVAGREFFDAIIAVDRIEGFEVKVRP